MNSKSNVLFLCFPLLLAACANPINRHTARNYYRMGVQAEENGDLRSAREAYRRAYINTQFGSLTPGEKAYTLYEYGRTSGYLCDYEEAEFALKESIKYQDMDEEVRANLRPPTLFELARFYFDTDRKSEAIPYYEEGIQLVKEKNVEETNPFQFATILEEYSICLKSVGRTSESETLLQKAQEIRKGNPEPKREQPFYRYNNCENK